MKVIRIGVAPQARIRERLLAIARLEAIRTAKPESIGELADLTGRKQGNLSRTLKTLSCCGLVKMLRFDRKMRPAPDAECYQIVA